MKDPTGRDAEAVVRGSTLSNDQHPVQSFAYQLGNPPYGKDWKMDRRAVGQEANKGYAGRFGAGTPRISDGQLLFLQHMLSKMPDTEAGGGRVAIIMNGSPLFTGDAGSGESEIRRWILENDWLEALIALPEQLFYNTGIATYVWILSNRKQTHCKGKVQLIDAGDMWESMHKSLGNKRRELSPDQIQAIVDTYQAFTEQTGEPEVRPTSKIFEATEFGYRKIRVERPLRLNFQASEERIARVKEARAFRRLAESRKRDAEMRLLEIEAGKIQQVAILAMLSAMDPLRYKNAETFRTALNQAAKQHGLKLTATLRKAIAGALSERDETAGPVVDSKGHIVPDPNLRDYERVPLDRAVEEYFVEEYFAEEVLPHVPDAWIDEDYADKKDGAVGHVGYEINFNRYFYEYTPPRPLDEIAADLRALEKEIVAMLGEVTGNGLLGGDA